LAQRTAAASLIDCESLVTVVSNRRGGFRRATTRRLGPDAATRGSEGETLGRKDRGDGIHGVMPIHRKAWGAPSRIVVIQEVE
jgi:hypothetical protein